MIPTFFNLNEYNELTLFRRIKQGGDTFVDHYLEKFSERETDASYQLRASLSPSAAFAKKEVVGVQNAIYQRLTDITRIGGSDSYKMVVAGKDGGIDLDNASMSHFVGQDVLSELLFMGKVGVLIDMPQVQDNMSISDASKMHPYCYVYKREQVLNWTRDQIDNRKTLTALKLEESVPVLDGFGLPTNEVNTRYKIFNRLQNQVRMRVFDKKGIQLSEQFLNIPEIPFVLFEIPNSLLHETAKYQVALMNLESSDIAYALKANFAFYVEPTSALNGGHLKKTEEIEVGNVQGRLYSGDKQPAFINPSSEPLKASMDKQEQIKDSIKEQINLAVTSVAAKSADSKKMDERGLESGLSAIGEILEHGERKIAEFYAAYEGSKDVATINYPDRYSLKSDKERIEEVKLIQEQKDEMPSLKGKKALCKMAARTLFDTKLSVEDVEAVLTEIEDSNNTGASAKTIVADVEAGILGHETASTMRGYSASEANKAATEHAERLARIEIAQTSAAARGVIDKAPDLQGAKEEKQQSQDPTLDDMGKTKTRGDEK